MCEFFRGAEKASTARGGLREISVRKFTCSRVPPRAQKYYRKVFYEPHNRLSYWKLIALIFTPINPYHENIKKLMVQLGLAQDDLAN
jgi:hypothetical protein